MPDNLNNIPKFKTNDERKTCALNVLDRSVSCPFVGRDMMNSTRKQPRYSCLISCKSLKYYNNTCYLKPLPNCILWSKE